jgi:hypothetical protein
LIDQHHFGDLLDTFDFLAIGDVGVGASLSFFKLRVSTSSTRLDLPEPDTPVMQTSTPRGISMSMFFRLLARRLDLSERCNTACASLAEWNGFALAQVRRGERVLVFQQSL